MNDGNEALWFDENDVDTMNVSDINCLNENDGTRLELIYLYFSTFVPSNICIFLSCRPFVVITTLSTVLVGVEVTSISWLGQLIVGV